MDIGSVFAGIGLAVVAFIVVIVVCAVILVLLAAILPSYEGRTTAELREKAEAAKAEAAGGALEHASPLATDGGDTVTPSTADDPSSPPDGET